jgi:NTP pyrophosphatase (non-canonical NTP hydrolase)
MNLRQFQKIIKDTYFEKDSKRGTWQTFGWLVEEIGELSKDIKRKDKKAQEYELGDCLAWLVSLANLLEIDASAAIEKYAKGCPKCKKMPCACPEPKK